MPANDDGSTRFTFTLPNGLHSKALEHSAESGVPLGETLRRLLGNFLAEWEVEQTTGRTVERRTVARIPRGR